MKAAKCSLVALGLSAAMVIAGPVQAAGLIFLNDSAAARMTDDDFTAMTKAAVEALDDATVPSTKVWTNPKTGSGGTVKTVQAFSAKNGDACKVIEHNTQAKKLTHEAKSTLCKVDGSWKLVSDDYAKAPPVKK
jgi:surface antigen